MSLIDELLKYTQACVDLAEKYPEPYRTQALAIIAKQQNWPAKFEKLTNKLIKQLEAAE